MKERENLETAAPEAEPLRNDSELAAGDSPAGSSESAPWLPSPVQVHRYRDTDLVVEAAAKRFVESARRAVDREDRFVVVLAGGALPRSLYRRLADPPYRDDIPWTKTYFVFGDEPCVSPDDEASHYRMVRETLFEPLAIPSHRVLRMKGEQAPAEAARRYAVRLADLFLNQPKRHFDLVLLDVGCEGNAASLFPGTQALLEREAWVAANHVPKLDAWRVTLTLPALNSARRVLFLATGEDRAQIVAEAFDGREHGEPYPCELVVPPHARREVLIDHAAAGLLPVGARPAENEDSDS